MYMAAYIKEEKEENIQHGKEVWADFCLSSWTELD